METELIFCLAAQHQRCAYFWDLVLQTAKKKKEPLTAFCGLENNINVLAEVFFFLKANKSRLLFSSTDDVFIHNQINYS